MKTAAAPQRKPAAQGSQGGGSRQPFFRTVVAARTQEKAVTGNGATASTLNEYRVVSDIAVESDQTLQRAHCLNSTEIQGQDVDGLHSVFDASPARANVPEDHPLPPGGTSGEEVREKTVAEAPAAEPEHQDQAQLPPNNATPSQPDSQDGGLPEPDLILPHPVDQGPEKQVAAVEQLDLSGNADQTMTRFIDASPSVMAASQPSLAPAIGRGLQHEQQDFAQHPPVLEVKVAGNESAPPVDAVSVPNAVPPLAPASTDAMVELRPSVTEKPLPPYRDNAVRGQQLDDEDSGSFWDGFKSFLKSFVNDIRTRDDRIDTSAGDSPQVALTDEAGASQLDSLRAEGEQTLRTQRDAQIEAFRSHPGQAAIQPKKLEEQCPVAISVDTVGPVELQSDDALSAYAAAPLPQAVRTLADARIATTLVPNLASARADTITAADSRDKEKAQHIDDTQRQGAKINADTDMTQRGLVIDNRRKVAGLQRDGIVHAREEVNAFVEQARLQQGSATREIGDHITQEEGKARDALKQGEKEAEKEKLAGEQNAEQRKADLEMELENQGWWDRAKDAIKRAVKFISDAIDKVFTFVREKVRGIVERVRNAAIGLINAARNWVINRINNFRAGARDKVNAYLKNRFPDLVKRINEDIDAVTDRAIAAVNHVADAAVKGVTELADSLAATLDTVLKTFQSALKTAGRVVGSVLQGDFAQALRAAIGAACELAGVPPKPVFDFFDRAGKAIMAILMDPVSFIKKLFGAVGGGIGSFFNNIRKHLIAGVIGWLTGALAEGSLPGPFEFSARGILGIVLQILGVTYENIKARVIKKVPAAAKVFDLVERGYGLLKKLFSEGPVALWEEIKARLADLKNTVMGSVRSWLITTVIKEGIVWLLSLTNPASALVKTLKLVFDLVMFLQERYEQIKDFIVSVYQAVADVAAGNFDKVSLAIESALARVVPVLISLLASILGLGSIGKQVKKVIAAVTAPINKSIDWVIDKIAAFAKNILVTLKGGVGAIKAKARQVAARISSWWRARSAFRDASGEAHMLSYKGTQGNARLNVASEDPRQIQVFLNDRRVRAKQPSAGFSVAQVNAAERYYKDHVTPAENRLKTAQDTAKAKDKGQQDDQALVDDLQHHLDRLGTDWLSKFFEPDEKDYPPPKLPVMANNAKAKDLEADYLVGGQNSGYKYKVSKGTESKAHVGNLGGWAELRGAQLTKGAKYVRMHLLPHRLGGNAVDSNLTPARGDLFNTPFSHDVEQPAIKSSVEGDDAQIKPIWYQFRITYFPSTTPAPLDWTPGVPYPIEAFPDFIEAKWGFYKKREKNSEGIVRDDLYKIRSATPPAPDLVTPPPSINDDSPAALYHALRDKESAITSYFISDILIPHRKYASKEQMRKTLWLEGTGERAVKRQQSVQTVYAAIDSLVTLNRKALP